MLGLHKVVNKISIIDIWQCSEYALSSEYTSVTQASVENSPSYIFNRFLSIPWALSMLRFKYTRVVNMPRLLIVLCKLYFKDSQYCMSWGFFFVISRNKKKLPHSFIMQNYQYKGLQLFKERHWNICRNSLF